MLFPMVHLEGNRIYNDRREAWAIYRLEPWHYDHLSVDERLHRLGVLSRLFWQFEEFEGQVLLVPHRHGVVEHLQALKESCSDGPLQHLAVAYCDGASDYLRGALGADSVDMEPYLLLKLDRQSEPTHWRDWLSTVWQEPRRLIEDLAGVRTPAPITHEAADQQQKEQLLFQRLNQIVRAERPAAGEVAWLIRRGFFRGIETLDPAIRLSKPPPSERLSNLAEGDMDLRNPRQITITQAISGGTSTSYQSFCVVSELPDEFTFPGSEWLFGLQDLTFPVEVCIRWTCENYRDALATVRKKQLEINDQDRHMRTSGENIPLSLLDSQDQAILLENDLKTRKFPLLHTSIILGVSASTSSQLGERMKQLRDSLMASQIRTEVPAGDQLACFMDCLPGSTKNLTDYTFPLPPETLAGSMFLATRALGDRSGPYIGRTGVHQKPVYLDPSLPPRINLSASMSFIGAPGGGKSFAANLLTYLAVISSGARALILDPKGERSLWLQSLPELAGHLNVVTLSPSTEDTGKLDPFIIGRGLGETGMREMSNLAISLLSFLTGARPGDQRFLCIVQAVEAIQRRPAPSLSAIFEIMSDMGRDNREAAELASYLKAVSNLAYANLLFGKGDEESINANQPVNILQLQNITMPSPAKMITDYTLEEHLSVTLMHAVTAFAMQFTRKDRGVFKIVLLDEAWSILGSSQGKSLVGQLLRTGRAMNNAVYLVTQNCSDLLDETIKNNLGVKFVFRSKDRDEIGRVLEFMNLEPNEENEMTVRSLDNGTALMQDLDGRVGVVRIDPVYQHLLDAFNTNPESIRQKRSL